MKPIGVILLLVSVGLGQEAVEKLFFRFGHEFLPQAFPQKTPQETMQSVVKALGEDRFDYVLAHLADPRYVDSRVARHAEDFAEGTQQARTILGFRRLVNETRAYFRDHPALLKELRLFAREAEWDLGEDVAVGTSKQLAGRQVFLRRLEERWFLENKQKK